MKRFLSVLLSLCLLCAALGGCQRDLPTTTVLIEGNETQLPEVTMLLDLGALVEESEIESFLETVPGCGQEFYVQVGILPNTAYGAERDQRLRRVRTEIMAGEGPDLFVTDCYLNVVTDAEIDAWGVDGRGPLFNFPRQAMDSRVFLPLDSYIENARFMEFDRLDPTIMAAGRNDEGQQLLPMTFDFTVASYLPSEDDIQKERPKSRQEMMDSGYGSLEYTAKGAWGRTLLDVFPVVIDQKHDTLAFTEKALLERALEFWEARHTDWGWGDGVFRFCADPSNACEPISTFMKWESPAEDAVLVPSYHENGGVSAYVTTYAAINRNANYPDYAFAVLDKLLSRSEMNKQRIYGMLLSGLPVYNGANGGEAVFGGRSLPPELLAQYRELMSLVDHVRFLTLLDQELVRTVVPVCDARDSTPEDVEKAVHETYRTMEMMLAES